MSRFIDDKLRADPSCTSLELPVDAYYLRIINNYCAKFDYLKVMSTLIFPASHNQLQKNVTFFELQALTADNLDQDIDGLKKLLVFCKELQIEALYELACCAIACFFKSRTNAYFSQHSAEYAAASVQAGHVINRQQQIDQFVQKSDALHQKFPFLSFEQERKNFEF